MWHKLKEDLRDVYRQVIAGVILAGAALLWLPTRQRLLAELSLPGYAVLALTAVAAVLAWGVTRRVYRKKIDALTEEVRDLKLQAVTDDLTGLPDAQAFKEKLVEEYNNYNDLVAQGKDYLSLILLDIDNFKALNESYRHEAGDEVMRSISALIRSNVRGANDFLGRSDDEKFFGKFKNGDEFGIILPGTSLVDARDAVAERLRKVIEGHSFEIRHQGKAKSIDLTISAGVATLQTEVSKEDGSIVTESLMSFVNRADEALNTAKDAGKNTVRRLP